MIWSTIALKMRQDGPRCLWSAATSRRFRIHSPNLTIPPVYFWDIGDPTRIPSRCSAWFSKTSTLEPLAKRRLGLGLLIETGTNITIVVGKRHLCPRSVCELVDFARASLIYFSLLFSTFLYSYLLLY